MPFHEIVAATHTPFHLDGSVNIDAIEIQATHMLNNGVNAVFVCGTTGECSSLTSNERRAIAKRWVDVAHGTAMRVIVHVGSNSIDEATNLANHAEQIGVTAIAALPPYYFKPASVDSLVACCSRIAEAAPRLPFYYYDIPPMTGVGFTMPTFLEVAGKVIPNLAGVKFSNSDLLAYQLCVNAEDGKWDMPFGCDEYLLAALSLGARGAVGSSYNFAAPIYHRIITLFAAGKLEDARLEQLKSARLIRLLTDFGFMASAKCVMEMLGVPVGRPRLPHLPLSPEREAKLKAQLEDIGFDAMIRI